MTSTTVLLGRATELTAVIAAIKPGYDGGGCVIEGDAGIGKTTLWMR